MKASFTAVVWQEDDLFVAQCLEVDVASQGRTEEEATMNLREALELYFEDAEEVTAPKVVRLEVQIGAA
jgi:predicted RNase H-like HicB family nuclease